MSDKWEITRHVCGVCFGRLLMRDSEKTTIVRCSDCGIEAEGSVKGLCSCGSKLNTGRDAGFRCETNPDYIAGMSQEIVAVYRGGK